MKKINYYLTIDVGTKNLAICLCSYDSKKSNEILKNINIIDWEIIDVSFKPLYCKQIKNKRAICGCIARFYSLEPNTTDHSNPNNLIGYCKSHVKKIREYNKNKDNKNKQIKIFSIVSNPIYKNNFSTQMEKLLAGLENFYNNIIHKPYNYINNKFFNISNLNIYIENQPVLKNPIMKSISVGIYTFFCMKKISNQNIISSVNFINASVKTKPDFIQSLNKIIDLKSNIKDFKKYINRKDFSEDIVGQIIPKLSCSIEYINNIISTSKYILRKKKDDMADTLLYIIYIILYFT